MSFGGIGSKSVSPETIMKGSASEPLLTSLIDEIIPDNEIPIHFEGDGPLGILFSKENEDAIVSGITAGTTASEEIKLIKGLKLLKIEGYHCLHISYKDIMEIIFVRWTKYSRISLTFEINAPPIQIKCEIYEYLVKNTCEKYYADFIDLGVKDIEDLNFIELQDLINMKMNTRERNIIKKSLNNKMYSRPYMDLKVIEEPSKEDILDEFVSDPYMEDILDEFVSDDV